MHNGEVVSVIIRVKLCRNVGYILLWKVQSFEENSLFVDTYPTLQFYLYIYIYIYIYTLNDSWIHWDPVIIMVHYNTDASI